ncbi:MAG: helix-turn-helix domain-containing protein, partial [Bacteroidia bacterium]
GKQENHFFFVAGRNDNIQMLLESLDDPISTCKIVGLAVNNDIAQINEYKRAFYEINGENPALKAQLLNLAYQEQMQQIADSTQYVMAGLFALYNGNIYSSQNTHIYDSFLKKWQGNDSPYFKDFANKITPTKSTNYNFTWIIVALIIGLAIGIGFSIFWLKKRENLNPFESKSQLLNELSVQEKKVHRLLENGLSNKEISNELNIGVNTVKSHVSSILNKLKIKSRKEIMV